MKKLSILLIACLCCALFFMSCGSDDPDPSPEVSTASLVFAGVTPDPDSGLARATYWRNGERIQLPEAYDHTPGIAEVILDGEDVYIAANSVDENLIGHAVVYKNNELTRLTNGGRQSVLFGMGVFNGRWYATGYERNANGIEVAKYWTEEGETVLGDGVTRSWAMDMHVDGNQVTIIGLTLNENNATTSVRWDNGLMSTLNRGNLSVSRPRQIEVVDGVEYILASGFSNVAAKTVAVVWRNGVIDEKAISDNLRFVSPARVAIDGGNVYIAYWSQGDRGSETTYHIAYYRNNTLEELLVRDTRITIRDMAVKDGNVIVVAQDEVNSQPVLWVNGEQQSFDSGFSLARIQRITIE